MSNLCKSCGAPLKEGATKCIYCGTPVPKETAPASQPVNSNTGAGQGTSLFGSYDISSISNAFQTVNGDSGSNDATNHFADRNWRNDWAIKRKKTQNKLGIVLTNTANLKDSRRFDRALNDYIAKKSAEGVDYCILDISKQNVHKVSKNTIEEVVELLKKVYETAVPDYLMIVGDHTVVPCIKWKAVPGVGDKFIPSDLPYITLDTDSPWEGAEYSFENVTQVGRVPTCAETNFEEAVVYFENTAAFVPYQKITAFAYSSLSWVQTSVNEFKNVNPTMITSPDHTSNAIIANIPGFVLFNGIEDKYNLLCFDLHGSETTQVWYGDYMDQFFEAFESKHFPNNTNGYVICSVACYGAKPNVRVGKIPTILNYALTHKCVAFVGSTMSAWGGVGGHMSCANYLLSYFNEGISHGLTVGRSFLNALDFFYQRDINEKEIKTVAEFGLYGDPSVVLITGNAMKTFSASRNPGMSSTTKNPKKAFRFISCDGNDDDGMSMRNFSLSEFNRMRNMACTIRSKGDNFVVSNFSTMSGVEPKVYKLDGKEEYRAVYTKNVGDVSVMVSVHTDANGNIKETYVSK